MKIKKFYLRGQNLRSVSKTSIIIIKTFQKSKCIMLHNENNLNFKSSWQDFLIFLCSHFPLFAFWGQGFLSIITSPLHWPVPIGACWKPWVRRIHEEADTLRAHGIYSENGWKTRAPNQDMKERFLCVESSDKWGAWMITAKSAPGPELPVWCAKFSCPGSKAPRS